MTDLEPIAQPIPDPYETPSGPYDGPAFARAWRGLGVVANALTAGESPLAENFEYLRGALVGMALEATVASLHRGHIPVSRLYHSRDAGLFDPRATVATDPSEHLEAQLQAVEINFQDNVQAVHKALVIGYRDPVTRKYVAWPLEFAGLPDPEDEEPGIRLVTTGGEVLTTQVATYQVWLQRLPADDQRRLAVYAAEHHFPEPNEVANNPEEASA